MLQTVNEEGTFEQIRTHAGFFFLVSFRMFELQLSSTDLAYTVLM